MIQAPGELNEELSSIAVTDYTRAILNILDDFSGEKERLESTQRAVINILEDSLSEKGRIESTQRAVINILEDFTSEKGRLESTQRAILNILEDFTAEKGRLESTQRAALNILEDFVGEKGRLESTQRAIINILEDFTGEKGRLESTQRAMLNLLEDFDVERARAEAANREIRASYESLQVAKDATEALNRELESFSYSVSHDLRTPLRGVAGFSQVLLQDYSGNLDEQGRDYLKRIAAAAEKMGWLIDDLLKLSRLSRASMELAQVDLSMIVRKIAQRLSAADPWRKAEFTIAGGITAYGDERLLTVMMDNLMDNAWKFTKNNEETVIEFGARMEKDGQVYFIRDNGAGFDMTYAGKLFQPFQRVHRPEEFPGSGIGLATVNRVVNRHGGQVWIEGERNKGAAVYFRLEER